jgi:hypothetical protein
MFNAVSLGKDLKNPDLQAGGKYDGFSAKYIEKGR